MSAVPRPSHAPLFWVLFGAGGMLASLFGPAIVLFLGVQAPLAAGLPAGTLDYANIRALVRHGWVAAPLFALTSLLLWHAAHRLLHSLHDLGIGGGRPAQLGCYGAALAGTLACAAALLMLTLQAS